MTQIPGKRAEYQLRDLARISQQKPRTIRSWIDKGLLRGPDSRGRGARYDSDHLLAVRAIATLRDDHDMGLDAIGVLLERMRRAELVRLVATPPAERILEPTAEGALDYLRALRRGDRAVGRRWGDAESRALWEARMPPDRAAPEGPRIPLERRSALVPPGGRERADGGPAAAESVTRGRVERWLEVPVTPNVRLRVRDHGSDDDEEWARELAGRLRDLIDRGQ